MATAKKLRGKRRDEVTALDFITPEFPTPSTDASSSSSSSSSSSDSSTSSSSTSSTSPVIVVFQCYDGGAPNLYYLDFTPTNEPGIDRLRQIALANDDDEFHCKVFDQQLDRATVANWQQLSETDDVDGLRAALDKALPSGPEGDGWVDRDVWTVKEIVHKELPGVVAMVPEEPPEGFDEYFVNYATQILSLHLEKDLVRPAGSGAKGENEKGKAKNDKRKKHKAGQDKQKAGEEKQKAGEAKKTGEEEEEEEQDEEREL